MRRGRIKGRLLRQRHVRAHHSHDGTCAVLQWHERRGAAQRRRCARAAAPLLFCLLLLHDAVVRGMLQARKAQSSRQACYGACREREAAEVHQEH